MNTISKSSASRIDSDKSHEEFRSQLPFLFFLASIFFVNFTARIIFSPLAPTIEVDLGITHRDTGMFFLLISLGFFIGIPGSGFLSAVITNRNLISVAAIAIGLTLLPISFSPNKWVLLVGLFLLGVFAGIYFPSGLAAITAIVRPSQWGKAIAIHELAPNMGFVVAPMLAEFFLLWFSWRRILLLLGLSSLLMGLVYSCCIKSGNFHGKAPQFNAVLTLVKQRSFLIMLIVFCAGIGGTLGIYSMLPLYLVAEQGMQRELANTLIAISRIPCMAVVFAAGWATDRFGPRRTLSWIFIMSGVLTIALGLTEGMWTAVLVFLQPMITVCFAPAALVALSLTGTQETRQIVISFTLPLAAIIGGGVCPALIGIMGDAGLFGFGFAVVGGFILLVAILPKYLVFSKY